MILDPKSYGILKEFLSALDKYEFEYEIPENRYMIKIKGHIIGSVCEDSGNYDLFRTRKRKKAYN